LQEKLGNQNGLAACYASIGYIAQEQGDYGKAIDYYRKALALQKEPYNLAMITCQFGEVYEFLNNQDSALKYYQLSYEYFSQTNDKYQLNLTLNGLALFQQKAGNTQLATAWYQEAIKNGVAYKDSVDLSATCYD